MKHNESNMQISCVKWFRLAYPQYAYMLFSVPNGGTRGATEAKILKAEGVVAGVSDLILLIPRNGKGSLCFEMKTRTGVQRITQHVWQEEAEKHGNQYVVIRSFDEFKKAIEEYLGETDGTSVAEAREQLSTLLNKNLI